MAPAGSVSFSVSVEGLGEKPQVKEFELKGGNVIRIGRSPVADVHIDHRGISQYHAEIRLLPNGSGAPRLCVRDLSSNGTGLKRPGQDGDSSVCIKKDTDEPIVDGVQLLVPMRLKENHTGRAWLTVKLKGNADGSADEKEDGSEARNSPTDCEKSPPAPAAKARSDSASGSDKEEDQETARKKFVELLLKTREISGTTTYQQADKLLSHESAWKACDDATRKECFHIFVDHLGDTSSKKKDKKKGKEKDKDKEKGGKKKDKKDKGKKRPASESPDASKRNGKKRGRSGSGGSAGSRSPSRRGRRRGGRRGRSGSD